MDLLEIFLAASFFLLGTIAFFSLIATQSKDFKDYPEVHTVSLYMSIASVVFFLLSAATVYLGLASK
jgi:hypothetical protein